jgi:hypothetical protein
MTFDFPSMDAMAADMEARMAESNARRTRVEQDYEARRMHPERIGTDTGPVHAASILVWARLAEIAGIPFIPADTVATLTMDTVMAMAEGDESAELAPGQMDEIRKAVAYANGGGYWRTEICAGEEVKYLMGSGQSLPDVLPIRMDDLRIYEMHWGMPCVTIVGRPKLTPVRHAGYPVEFRVFNGCQAEENGAVSWYYPQAGAFEPTPELEVAMTQAAEWGKALHELRDRMGLVAWLPEMGEPSDRIGSTIDFMLTEEMGLVMVDAGPGYGAGAHPCCFIDQPVAGRAWALAEGVEVR